MEGFIFKQKPYVDSGIRIAVVEDWEQGQLLEDFLGCRVAALQG